MRFSFALAIALYLSLAGLLASIKEKKGILRGSFLTWIDSKGNFC